MPNSLLISTGFLKYPLELKKNSVRTEKKNSVKTEKKFQYKLTEFLSQFEINGEMDISKNQRRSTGTMLVCVKGDLNSEGFSLRHQSQKKGYRYTPLSTCSNQVTVT